MKHTDDTRPCVRPRSEPGSSAALVPNTTGMAVGSAECGSSAAAGAKRGARAGCQG